MWAKLVDGWNFVRKLTLLRLWNIIHNLSSYAISKYTSMVVHPAMPMSISIEPTTSCNLRCPECPSGLRSFTRPTGMLQSQLFEKVIDEMAPTLSYLLLYFQGEPYLHKQFFGLVNYAHKKGIYTSTSTNGHYLDAASAEATVRSGLDRLIISIDGTTQDTYEAYRVGGRLHKVLDGTRNIIEAKRKLRSSTPYVVFQFLVVRPNEHEIPIVEKLAKDLGVDELSLKSAQIYDYENGSDLIPTIDRYSRYRKNSDGTYSIKNDWHNNCWKMWHSCVVTWDGKVVPCCFDKDAHHAMGSLQNESFSTIWNNPQYQAFRSALFHSRSSIEMCRNCTEGTIY